MSKGGGSIITDAERRALHIVNDFWLKRAHLGLLLVNAVQQAQVNTCIMNECLFSTKYRKCAQIE